MRFFAAVRPANSTDAGDASELGQLTAYELLPFRKHEDELRDKVGEVIARTTVFRNAQAKYRILDVIMYHVLRNDFSKSAHTVNSSLMTLNSNEARKIAKSFSFLLMTNATPDMAVDEWIMMFPAIIEFADEYGWFEPMMDSIAGILMGSIKFGVATRAYLGAGISMMDMASDAFVINGFSGQGRTEFAILLAATVVLNLIIQLLICIVQARGLKENRWKHLLLNSLFVITFTKPGIDAYRYASGADRLPGSAANAQQELIWSKSSEMFCEAIPGFVIQSVGYLTSKEKTTSALVSLALSAASASMTSTTSAYDYDISRENRKKLPKDCGMIPDYGRGLAFGIMLSLGTLQIITKGISVALLAITNARWLTYFVIFDYATLFVYKIARHDILTWHALPYAISVPFSIFMRIATKTISDFSGGMLARDPDVMGGLYYSYGLVQTQASVLVAVHAYNEYYEVVAEKGDGAISEAAEGEAADGTKLSASTTWTVAFILLSVWTLLYLFFIFKICVPKFRSCFWSSKTGSKMTLEYFEDDGANDSFKFEIFDRNRVHWKVIEDDVKEWTLKNWATWVAEKPAWFTDEKIAMVPDEFIPPAYLSKLGPNRERRKSAVDSVRVSMRKMSAPLQPVELPA
jgi:hypothetical protein